MSTSKLNIASQLKSIESDDEFWSMAQSVFDFQYQNCEAYQEFVNSIKPQVDIRFPFIPIEAFKWRDITTQREYQQEFKSSGTTNAERSRHRVYDVEVYKTLSRQHFQHIYGNLNEWVILALLPSYLEKGDSSLVFMVNNFISQTGQKESTFISGDNEQLHEILQTNLSRQKKVLLIGVSYALLDFCQKNNIDHENLVVMETGGMKGRANEMTRNQLHMELRKGFPNAKIHSEYGMTELLSQGYCLDGEWFIPPKWMRAFVSDISDPMQLIGPGKRGQLAFIDLANYFSCSFIQTRDIGIVNVDGSFKVEGRLDNSDLRGCNLLYT